MFLVHNAKCSVCTAGDEGTRELASGMEHGWISRHCHQLVDESSQQCDVDVVVDRKPETEEETAIPVCVLNGRSPTLPSGEERLGE